MKKYIFFFLFFFVSSANAIDKFAYLDIQYIIDFSDIGKFYKKKIGDMQNQYSSQLLTDEKKIKKKENDINNQKNILKKEEINKKLLELNNLVKDYQKLRKKNNQDIIQKKKEYSSKILKLINPILTNYVQYNKIDIVIDKKNILVGIKTLDITKEILAEVNKITKEKNLINEN